MYYNDQSQKYFYSEKVNAKDPHEYLELTKMCTEIKTLNKKAKGGTLGRKSQLTVETLRTSQDHVDVPQHCKEMT